MPQPFQELWRREICEIRDIKPGFEGAQVLPDDCLELAVKLSRATHDYNMSRARL